jgi:hypothetical protein
MHGSESPTSAALRDSARTLEEGGRGFGRFERFLIGRPIEAPGGSIMVEGVHHLTRIGLR